MKRLIVFISIAFSGVIGIHAQDLQSEQMRSELNTNLSVYHTLFEKLLEHIEAIQKSSSGLPEKLQNNERVKALVKELNKRFPGVYKNINSINDAISELSDSLNAPKPQAAPQKEEKVSPNQPPIVGVHDTGGAERQPQAEGYQDPKASHQVVHPAPVPAKREDEIKKDILNFSLTELNSKDILDAKRKEVVEKLKSHGNRELLGAYVAIFDLLNVQYEIYNRIRVKDYIQRASSIRKELLSGKHNDELQAEIERVKEYRYATMELQRLINIVSNPSNDIKKELGYGSSGSGDSKWAVSEDLDIPSAKIRDYLNKKNETEYVRKFDYTLRTFNDYVDKPDCRDQISRDISAALK